MSCARAQKLNGMEEGRRGLLETPELPTTLPPSFFQMEHQDWTTVQVKRPIRPTVAKAAAAQLATHNSRLDGGLDGGDLKPKKRRLTMESRQALVAARTAVKKSQRDVDKELAFPPNTIRDFEAGTAGPSGAQISALHRHFAAARLVLKVETV
jgi:hypothetical protein